MPKPFSKAEWIEAGIAADQSLGRPARRTAKAGIKEMKERIRHLAGLKRNAKNPDRLKQLNAEIRTARIQLAACELQLKSRN